MFGLGPITILGLAALLVLLGAGFHFGRRFADDETETRNCARCSHRNAPNALFCAHCGKPLSATKGV